MYSRENEKTRKHEDASLWAELVDKEDDRDDLWHSSTEVESRFQRNTPPSRRIVPQRLSAREVSTFAVGTKWMSSKLELKEKG